MKKEITEEVDNTIKFMKKHVVIPPEKEIILREGFEVYFELKNKDKN